MELEEALRKLGVESLNPMQAGALAAARGKDADIVILSPTGTGKTLAYLLPLAESVSPGSDAVQALVLVPGREMAGSNRRSSSPRRGAPSTTSGRGTSRSGT